MAEIVGYIIERSVNDSAFLPGLFLIALAFCMLVLFINLPRDS